jgi:hypothetical protein
LFNSIFELNDLIFELNDLIFELNDILMQKHFIRCDPKNAYVSKKLN